MIEDSFAALASAMKSEAAVFEAYVEGQKRFADALHTRDWRELQESISLLEGISQRLSDTEQKRSALETAVRAETGCMDSSFYHLALAAPEPQRSELADLYRKLKISAMHARFETEAAGQYAEENKSLLSGVLDALFPEKKGNIYSRSGKTVQAERDALVLNTAL